MLFIYFKEVLFLKDKLPLIPFLDREPRRIVEMRLKERKYKTLFVQSTTSTKGEFKILNLVVNTVQCIHYIQLLSMK